MSIQQFNSANAPKPVGLYPFAKRVGNLLFMSGIGPRDARDNSIPGNIYDEGNVVSYDIEAQCHSVFRNVKAVLDASGSKWENLIDVTIFLTNMKDDFSVVNTLYAEYFKEAQPCRTTVEINALPTPIAIELKCVAYVD